MARTYKMFSGKDLEVAELILRRRMQMLVHSYLYYVMSTNLISDREFDMLGKELVQLQADYPDIAKQVEYAEAFSDWDGATGFHLPRNEQVIRIANRLLRANRHTKEVVTKTVTKPTKITKNGRKSLF